VPTTGRCPHSLQDKDVLLLPTNPEFFLKLRSKAKGTSAGRWLDPIEWRFPDAVLEGGPAAVLVEVGGLAAPIDPPPYPLRMPFCVYVP
jgi:hypothetical protein